MSTPDAHCTVLASGEDVVRVGVDGGDGASGGVGDLPDLALTLNWNEATEESVGPSGHNSTVVLGKGNGHTLGSFVRVSCEQALVVGKVP